MKIKYSLLFLLLYIKSLFLNRKLKKNLDFKAMKTSNNKSF